MTRENKKSTHFSLSLSFPFVFFSLFLFFFTHSPHIFFVAFPALAHNSPNFIWFVDALIFTYTHLKKKIFYFESYEKETKKSRGMWHDENGFSVKQRRKNVSVTRTGTPCERDRMRMNTHQQMCKLCSRWTGAGGLRRGNESEARLVQSEVTLRVIMAIMGSSGIFKWWNHFKSLEISILIFVVNQINLFKLNNRNFFPITYAIYSVCSINKNSREKKHNNIRCIDGCNGWKIEPSF